MVAKFPEELLTYTSAIDKTHMGLGIHALVLQTCEHANQSTKLIGTVGTGKSAILQLIYPFKAKEKVIHQEWFTFTYDEMYSRWGTLRDAHITMWIDDMRSFSHHHMTTFSEIIPGIMTQHKFFHKMGDNVVDLKNCTLTCHIGIQPRKDADLISRSTGWAYAAKDRILPIALCNPLVVEARDDYPKIRKKQRLKPLTYDLKSIEIDADVDITPVLEVFSKYLSPNRHYNWTIKFLRATASLMHHDKVDEDVVQFVVDWELPILSLYDTFMTSNEVVGGYMSLKSQDLTFFQYVALHGLGGVTRKQAANYFKVKNETISTVATRVKNLGLIKNRKIRKENRYVITGKYARFFFSRYRRLYR